MRNNHRQPFIIRSKQWWPVVRIRS